MERKKFMLRMALACLLLACSSAPRAGESEPVQVWLDPGFLSYHFKDENYRQDNWGFGVGVFIAPEHGFIAGTFLNSNDERSHYAAYHWRPLGWNPAGVSVRAGLALGLIDGYANTNDGHWFPFVLPALTAEYGRLGANFLIGPAPNGRSALALQLRLRVW